jgi:hypothetical protein
VRADPAVPNPASQPESVGGNAAALAAQDTAPEAAEASILERYV